MTYVQKEANLLTSLRSLFPGTGPTEKINDSKSWSMCLPLPGRRSARLLSLLRAGLKKRQGWARYGEGGLIWIARLLALSDSAASAAEVDGLERLSMPVSMPAPSYTMPMEKQRERGCRFVGKKTGPEAPVAPNLTSAILLAAPSCLLSLRLKKGAATVNSARGVGEASCA